MNPPDHTPDSNGPVWAALLASGIGAFAMGFAVILNESGLFASPTLYAPAGGVSGRTTIAAIVWLVAWVWLHRRWRHREIEGSRVTALALLLLGLGVLGTFPPLWAIF